MPSPAAKLSTVELQTAADPRHAVIWLHGLGADAHDFEPVVPELVEPAWPALRFVFPNAPMRPITVNGGMRMRAWYDVAGFDIAQRQDEEGMRGSVALLEELIAREAARGVPAENLVLAGFSQGGAIALACGLRHAARLGGIVVLSSYLPLGEKTAAEAHAANRQTPIFFGHGTADTVVPPALGTMSRDLLLGLGYPVQWHAYPMPHSVCAQEIADLRHWLGARLR